MDKNSFINYSEEEEIKQEQEIEGENIGQEEIKAKKESIDLETNSKSSKKFILPLVILLTLGIFAGAFFYIYNKTIGTDPISLLPVDTSYYIRVKINPDNEQVKNLKELLNKFPNYEKASKAIKKEFKKQTYVEYPMLSKIDLTIFEEAIFAFTCPLEEIKKPGFPPVVIFSHPDLTEVNKLINNIKELIKENKGVWRLEEEKYKDRTIIKAVPKESEIDKYYYMYSKPKIELSFALVEGQFIIAEKSDEIKKIIDVADSKGITNIFKRDRVKSIASNPTHKKISRYLPKDYLVLVYSESDWSKILETTKGMTQIDKIENPLTSLTANSLTAFLGLSLLGPWNDNDSDKTGTALVLMADENGLKSEAYYLDSREDIFSFSEFSLKSSLAKSMPEKIGKREIVSYAEGKNLYNSWEQTEKLWEQQAESLDEIEKEEFNKAVKELEGRLGVNLKDDIMSLFENNYAFFTASDSSGEQDLIIGFISDIDDKEKVKENLLELKIPKEFTNPIGSSLGGARAKAKDARITSDMHQIRIMAIMVEDSQRNYKSVNCFESDIKLICDDIQEYVGSEPIFHSSQKNYCAYTKLNEYGAFYCVDDSARAIKTYIDPSQKGYCTGTTFVCPISEGIKTILPESEIEKVAFSREVIDGFEIFTMPLFKDFSLNFSIKDGRLLFSLTQQGLVDFLHSFSDSNQKRLADLENFNQAFKKIPKNVVYISYSYPYGFLGIAKYGVNYYFNTTIEGAIVSQEEVNEATSQINEVLDKGIAPYLKMLKRGSSYSYSPEKGLKVNKGRLLIEELSEKEKKETEEFWQDFAENYFNYLPFFF